MIQEKNNIYVSKRHIESDDPRISEFYKKCDEIKNNLSPSKSDNYRKDLILVKKIKTNKKSKKNLFFVMKIIMLKNLYNVDYLKSINNIESDFFRVKKSDDLMCVTLKDLEKIKIKVLNEKQIIRTEVLKGWFGRWIYKVHITFSNPLLMSTLKGFTYKRDIVGEIKKDLKKQHAKFNLGIKEATGKTKEEIIKIDFNNLK